MAGKRLRATPVESQQVFHPDHPGRIAFGYLSAIGGALIGLILTGLVSVLPPETFCSANSDSFESAYCQVGLLIITGIAGTLLGTAIVVTFMTIGKLLDFWFLCAYASCLIGMLTAGFSWVQLFLEWWGYLPYLLFPALSALASARWVEYRPMTQRIILLASLCGAITAFVIVAV